MSLDQEIIDNAPDGATHISEDYGLIYLRADPDEYVSSYNNFRWGANDVRTELLHFHTVRSLADIKELVELRKTNAELEKERDELKSYKKTLQAKVKYCISEEEMAIRELEQQKEAIDILYKAGKCDADCLKYFEALKEPKL